MNQDRHEYDGMAVINGEEQRNAILLSRFKDGGRARRVALRQALEAAQMTGVQRVKVYHSHPSPGPQSRYVGQVFPDGVFMDANGHQETIS